MVVALKLLSGGFSLIELMIVIGIVGILATLAVPVFGEYRAVARDGMAQADARNAISVMTAAQK